MCKILKVCLNSIYKNINKLPHSITLFRLCLNSRFLLAYLVLAENYKSHSTNRVSQYREERSAQNKEESGAISTGTSKSKQDVDNPKR